MLSEILPGMGGVPVEGLIMRLDESPKCGKCGAPITTAAMAMMCPHGRGCEAPKLTSLGRMEGT